MLCLKNSVLAQNKVSDLVRVKRIPKEKNTAVALVGNDQVKSE